MGRVRTKTVKRAAKRLIEKYYSKLRLDFDYNKLIIKEVAVVQSKRLRNKIAGYTTHLMKRLNKGQVIRGVSLKVQEEEREKRLEQAPDESAVNIAEVLVSKETKLMLDSLGFENLPVQVQDDKAKKRRYY